MARPLVVVTEAFTMKGSVQLTPRLTVRDPPRESFAVELRLPDGTRRAAQAIFDVAHLRGPEGSFAMVRLLGLTPEDVPVGTEVWPA